MFLCLLVVGFAWSLAGCDSKVDTTLGSVLYQRTVLRTKSILSSGLADPYITGYQAGLAADTDEVAVNDSSREAGMFMTGFGVARELLNAEDQEAAKAHMADIQRMIEEGPHAVPDPG
ncbi:hypothetical protein PSMK_09170 [Phycisphaera mikurensis NBRC 102666]|uniref:Uncharacterized protein n=2 Tax=Phycisphaera TaxID=666508 RepID=I0ICT8_PHYMF|nr:hypothetical protein PSMK_09170 [Phycisphaera mikurensis NBRC 102666]